MEKRVLSHGSPWQGWCTLLHTALVLFLYAWGEREGWAVIYQWESISMTDRASPVLPDLGSVSLQAFLLCREISSLDSAFLLRRLPLFCVLLSLPLAVTTGGRESQLLCGRGMALGAGSLFSSALYNAPQCWMEGGPAGRLSLRDPEGREVSKSRSSQCDFAAVLSVQMIRRPLPLWESRETLEMFLCHFLSPTHQSD